MTIETTPPFRCAYCGALTWVDPSDQSPPLNYCDHAGEEPTDENQG